jgi:hypothetical protein
MILFYRIGLYITLYLGAGKQYIPTARARNNGSFNGLPQALHKPILLGSFRKVNIVLQRKVATFNLH